MQPARACESLGARLVFLQQVSECGIISQPVVNRIELQDFDREVTRPTEQLIENFNRFPIFAGRGVDLRERGNITRAFERIARHRPEVDRSFCLCNRRLLSPKCASA